MITSREDFLMQVLDCGLYDLKLIDDVNYDWCDILEESGDTSYQLNWLMRKVFEFGFGQINEALELRKDYLMQGEAERNLLESEKMELERLKVLDPFEDFESYHNFIDTHVWCEKHGSTYKKYLQEALDEFADGTGFEITIENEEE